VKSCWGSFIRVVGGNPVRWQGFTATIELKIDFGAKPLLSFYFLLFFTLQTLCLEWFVSLKEVVNPDLVSCPYE
jgi:hypothetical protein